MMRLLFASLFVGFSSFPALAAPPNFVIILADDMGYADPSCYGNDRYETPHIDQLAAEGLRFTDFHSNGYVCSPTRAAFVTGRYQQRTGVDTVVFADPERGLRDNHGLPPEETTFAEILKPLGYKTGIMGKWHLGYAKKFNPVKQGFDQFRGYVSGNVDFQSHIDQADFFDWWQNLELKDEPGYTTHLINRHAVRFIEENKDGPFCLYVPHEAPHSPYQGPNDPPVRGPNKQPPVKGDEIQRAYREMVQEVDKGVGQIMETLQRLGIAENTFVFFFSDNGGTNHANNGPLRGTKGTPWEGGHRVPGIAWWPNKIKAGTETDATAIGMDLLPTLAELAGVPLPEGVKIDGVSLVSHIFERTPLPERTLYWGMGGKFAVREGPWKLVVGESTGGKGKGKSNARVKPMLFHLENDLGEQTDLAGTQSERAEAMLAKLEAWKKDVTPASSSE